jgi:hypothetical protein
MNSGAGTGTLYLSGATPITVSGTGTSNMYLQGTATTVNYDYAGAQTVYGANYYNLTLSNSGAKALQTGTTAITGNFTLSGTATTTTADNLAISGTLNIGDGTSFTAGAYNITVNGTTTIGSGASGILTISSATGTKAFNGDVTLNTGSTWNNNTANCAIGIGGSLTMGGTFNAGTGIYTFSGATKTISGIIDIPSVTVSGTYTNNGTLTISSALAGGGTLTNGANGELHIDLTGTVALTNLTATAVGNLVDYGSAGAQTLKATTYHHLTISGNGAKTLQATTTVNGDFAVINGSTGTFANLAGKTITVAGNASLSGQSYATYLNLNPGSAWTLNVAGTLTATSARIAYSNASGGSTGYATNSSDLGNNSNWSIEAVWDGGAGDNKWSTAANWINDWVPSTCSDVAFNSTSSSNCLLDVSTAIRSLSLVPNHAGNFDFGSATLTLTENAIFSSNGSITPGTGTIVFSGAAAHIFRPMAGGVLHPNITQNGAGTTVISTNPLNAGTLTLTNGTFDLGDEGLTHTVTSVIGSAGGALDFGTSTLQSSGNVTLSSLTSITAGTGTLEFTGTSGTQTFAPINGTATHPDVIHSGAGTLQLRACYEINVSS